MVAGKVVPNHAVLDGDGVLWPPADPYPLGPPDKSGRIYRFTLNRQRGVDLLHRDEAGEPGDR